MKLISLISFFIQRKNNFVTYHCIAETGELNLVIRINRRKNKLRPNVQLSNLLSKLMIVDRETKYRKKGSAHKWRSRFRFLTISIFKLIQKAPSFGLSNRWVSQRPSPIGNESKWVAVRQIIQIWCLIFMSINVQIYYFTLHIQNVEKRHYQLAWAEGPDSRGSDNQAYNPVSVQQINRSMYKKN